MPNDTMFRYEDTAPIQDVIAALAYDNSLIVCSYREGGISFILRPDETEIKAVLFFYLNSRPWYILATASKEEIVEMIQARRDHTFAEGMFEIFALKRTGSLIAEKSAIAASHFIDHVWIGILQP